MAKWFGVSFPFFRGNSLLGSTSKVLPNQEDDRLIKNDLTQGLLTLKRERLFRPNFGGDVGSYLFDQNDVQSRIELEESIRRQIATYHDRIILTNIQIVEDSANPTVMVVNLFGRTTLDSTNTETLLSKFMIPIAGTVGGDSGRGTSNG